MAKKKKMGILKAINTLFFIYILGVVFFMIFTIPTKEVNGEKVGFKSLSSFKSNIATGDEIILKGKNDDILSFPASDINYVAPISSETPYEQNSLLWFLELISPKNEEVKVEPSFDYEKLKEKIVLSPFMDEGEDSKPKNAQVVFDEEKNEYIIEKEKYGSKLDLQKTMNHIVENLENGVYKTISIEETYEAPTILADNENLIKKKDNLNKIKDMKISYDFLSKKEVLTGDSLKELYSDHNGELVVNEEMARKYLVDLAIKYDTFGSSRKFKAKDIGEITVPGGIYGWEMNVDKTLEVLKEKLSNFESAELTPEYRIEGVYRDDYNDIGPTYVEVDIGRQHMWYFKDGEIVFDAPFVSGLDVEGRRTPLGVHQLWSKQKDTYLTGATWRTHVDYWMPIDWSGVGFHDASWRGSFGGEIYKTGGSHGCLNMPPNQAETFYNMVELNTPVVVYDSNKL